MVREERREAPGARAGDTALLERLLARPLSEDEALLDRLLADVRAMRPSAYAAPTLRPVAPCAPAPRIWPTARVVARPLQLAGAALLIGAIGLGSVAPAARAVAPAGPAAAQAARSAPAAPAARGLAVAAISAAPARAGRPAPAAVAARAAAPAPARAAAAAPAALPAFELRGEADEAAAPEVAYAAAPASRVAAIPQYRVLALPAVDLNAQTAPPYPQVAPPPPPPPAGGVEIYNPVNVEIYNPQPAPQPGQRPAARPPARPPTRPATRPTYAYPVAGANYVVRRGDYLRLISTWSYGTERLWPVIYDSNLRVVGANPDLIYPGQVLAIPVVSGRPTPRPIGGRRYTVQSGDTLASIALRVYGNAARWPEIYGANRAAIGAQPSLIFPGTVLALP